MNKKHQSELSELLVRLLSPRQICAVMSAIASENSETLPNSAQPSPKQTTSQASKTEKAAVQNFANTTRVEPDEAAPSTIAHSAKAIDALEMKLVAGGKKSILVSFNQQQVELTFKHVKVEDVEQRLWVKVGLVAPVVQVKEVPLEDVPAKRRRRAPKCSPIE